MKIKTPRVPFVNMSAVSDGGVRAREAGVLTRDGLAFLNSLDERIANLEALVHILSRQRNSETG